MTETRKVLLHTKMLHALKIGVGSAIAILIAEMLKLDFATSSGIITLLTISSTKIETFKLSLNRLITFAISVALLLIVEGLLFKDWLAYGFVLTMITLWISIKPNLLSTLSVNAVIMTHLISVPKITGSVILNELYLLIIGIVIAVIANEFQNFEGQRNHLEEGIHVVEKDFEEVFEKLSDYLDHDGLENHVWDDIVALEKKITDYLDFGYRYHHNRIYEDDTYYADYFEMRLQQCSILHNLHYEMKKIRRRHQDSHVIALFFEKIKNKLNETEVPKEQLLLIQELVEGLKKEMPTTKEEFLNKARMYHILMDLEEFFVFKQRFVETSKLKEKDLAH